MCIKPFIFQRLTWPVLALFSVLVTGPTPAQPVAEWVQTRCSVCHGASGLSTDAQFPQLAGQNEQYLRKQLQDFKSGRRSNPVMTPMAQELNEAQIDALAAYFSQQPGTSHPVDDDLLVQVGRYLYERGNIYSKVPACRSCHGDAGAGNARLPRLAGQHPNYVEQQLLRFQHKERQNDSGVMGFVTEGLTPLEMRAVAAYIGQLQPVASTTPVKKK
jgi:cytochrome c553